MTLQDDKVSSPNGQHANPVKQEEDNSYSVVNHESSPPNPTEVSSPSIATSESKRRPPNVIKKSVGKLNNQKQKGLVQSSKRKTTQL